MAPISMRKILEDIFDMKCDMFKGNVHLHYEGYPEKVMLFRGKRGFPTLSAI